MVDFRKAKRAPRLDLNPSAADRWTTCTASPQFILDNWDKVPSDETGYNQEGTTAHEVAAALLQDRPPDIKDKYKCPVDVTPEMRRHAWNYMEYVTDLIEPKGKLLVEQKLPLWYMPGRNAIVDAAIINLDSIHIIDFKYGEGVVVSPENNLQAVIYAENVIRQRWPFGDWVPPVYVHIFQPRGRAAEDAPSHTWKIETDEDFSSFSVLVQNVEFAAFHITNGTSKLVFAPSPKACQWCPAKGFCTARQQHFAQDIKALEVIPQGDKHLPPVKAVSLSQLSAILKHKKAIEKWLNDAEAYAVQHLSAGNTIPGWKLVTSRGGHRYWRDPKKAAKLLLDKTHLRRDEVIDEKVISPAQAETLLGKNKLSVELTELITRPPGVPVIAPEDDKRENCLVNVEEEFDVL